MNKQNRNYLLYLEDMKVAMDKIKTFIDGLNFSNFQNDIKTQDAVIRNFEVIGEASKNIPQSVKNKYPALPWDKMYGLRNIVSHEYFGVDLELIWKIASKQLPNNRKDLEEIIQAEKY